MILDNKARQLSKEVLKGGQVDEWINGWTDGQLDERMDGCLDGSGNQWMAMWMVDG